MSTSNPIPRRNSKRFNLTVSLIAAIVIAALIVFLKPQYDEYRASKSAEATVSQSEAAATNEALLPSPAPAQEPVHAKVSPVLEPRAEKRPEIQQPAKASGSYDPYANLQINKKGN